jgi:hypothetical protein
MSQGQFREKYVNGEVNKGVKTKDKATRRKKAKKLKGKWKKKGTM